MTWQAILIPPFIGAIIGYLTNSVAIRMLFRPLAEKRLLGIRIPLTPGVIPRQRAELADRIGAMVSQELLTEEVLIARIRDESFRHMLERQILRYVTTITSTSAETLHSVAEFEPLKRLTTGAARILHDMPSYIQPLQYIDRDQGGRMLNHLWVGISAELSISLQSPAVQQDVEARVRRIIRHAMDQMGTVPRLFVSATQYDRQIDQSVPQIAKQVIREAQEALEGEQLGSTLHAGFMKWMETHGEDTLQELLGQTDYRVDGESLILLTLRALQRRRHFIARRLTGWIQDLLASYTLPALAQLDIHNVVVDRINSLEVARVEALVLGIISKHLKWINLFGALVGALIGSIQVALRFIGWL
jgi:uncharacterized membrane protein YheB (UPF0754 family)